MSGTKSEIKWAVAFGNAVEVTKLPVGSKIEEECGCISVITRCRTNDTEPDWQFVYAQVIKGCEKHPAKEFGLDCDDMVVPLEVPEDE